MIAGDDRTSPSAPDPRQPDEGARRSSVAMRTLIAILLALVLLWLVGLLANVFTSTTAAAQARELAHAASVCADYPNQAAAQRAADTVDVDGDGIYCESLPCPCLKPGDPAQTPQPTPVPTPAPT